MYHHILIPVSFDDNKNAETAIAVAERLADERTKVSLLHVMEQVPGYAINYIPEGFHEGAKAAIVESLSTLGATLPNMQGEVIEGHAGRSILAWASEHGVDCIVIASHRPGMQDYFLGSTASQVVRHAKCAVHVVR
ncbi:universal stress protein [Shimia abyssi]|uniref:Nucleotide-binding universal stress UspA family protein n=1 Tax=Shimia abyssi TaxID=1662395 RepID=A0A2P8F8U3_9RHOB|nr:universal stress protein [Shimia abyssi]PSL18151.1 nucleotide-binding universal stress UspA family protein [Shimia abyssi]